MAAAPAKGSPLKNRKVIVIAVLGLLVVGYFFLRSKSPAAQTPSSSGATPGTIPQTASDASGQSTDQSSADLLAALAGENQDLMKSFLASSSGLVSLAGSSVGGPSSNSSAGEPSGTSGFASTTSDPFTSVDMPLSGGGDLSSSTPMTSALTAPASSSSLPFTPSQIQSVADSADASTAASLAPAFAGPDVTTGQYGIYQPFTSTQIQSVADSAVGATAASIAPAFTGPNDPTVTSPIPVQQTTYASTLQTAPNNTSHGGNLAGG